MVNEDVIKNAKDTHEMAIIIASYCTCFSSTDCECNCDECVKNIEGRLQERV